MEQLFRLLVSAKFQAEIELGATTDRIYTIEANRPDHRRVLSESQSQRESLMGIIDELTTQIAEIQGYLPPQAERA